MEANATRPVVAPGSRAAAALLDGIAAQDFEGLRAALAPDVHLRALVPGGLHEWTGAEGVAHRFERWFGHTEQFAVLERDAGEIAGRVALRWRLRLRAERLGPGWFVVEQVAYCDASDRAVTAIDLLCTGYLSDASGG